MWQRRIQKQGLVKRRGRKRELIRPSQLRYDLESQEITQGLYKKYLGYGAFILSLTVEALNIIDSGSVFDSWPDCKLHEERNLHWPVQHCTLGPILVPRDSNYSQNCLLNEVIFVKEHIGHYLQIGPFWFELYPDQIKHCSVQELRGNPRLREAL